jgi:hypothetical protein
MITDMDAYDQLPAKERLPRFLQHALNTGNYQQSITELSKLLQYVRPNVVDMWAKGRTAVPMKALTPIAAFLGFDAATLLPLWIASYMGDEDNDQLYRVAKRTLSAWEFVVIGACRDVYLGDIESDDLESLDRTDV